MNGSIFPVPALLAPLGITSPVPSSAAEHFVGVITFEII